MYMIHLFILCPVITLAVPVLRMPLNYRINSHNNQQVQAVTDAPSAEARTKSFPELPFNLSSFFNFDGSSSEQNDFLLQNGTEIEDISLDPNLSYIEIQIPETNDTIYIEIPEGVEPDLLPYLEEEDTPVTPVAPVVKDPGNYGSAAWPYPYGNYVYYRPEDYPVPEGQGQSQEQSVEVNNFNSIYIYPYLGGNGSFLNFTFPYNNSIVITPTGNGSLSVSSQNATQSPSAIGSESTDASGEGNGGDSGTKGSGGQGHGEDNSGGGSGAGGSSGNTGNMGQGSNGDADGNGSSNSNNSNGSDSSNSSTNQTSSSNNVNSNSSTNDGGSSGTPGGVGVGGGGATGTLIPVTIGSGQGPLISVSTGVTSPNVNVRPSPSDTSLCASLLGAKPLTGESSVTPVALLQAIPTVSFDSSSSSSPTVTNCAGSSSDSYVSFRNPSYPNKDSGSNDCSFRLSLTSTKVCQVYVKLDSAQFSGPDKGVCREQYLKVTGTIWPTGVKRFCGYNDGQHFYVEVDTSQNTRYVDFSIVTSTSTSYKWKIEVTSVDCTAQSALQAPSGCFQYFTSSSGSLKSFNFEGGQYFNDQQYRICIKAEFGACVIYYSTEDNHFMLEKYGSNFAYPYTRSGVTSLYCVRDYLRIPDASRYGYATSSTHDRYCGGRLAYSHGVKYKAQIISRIYNSIIIVEVRTGNPDIFRPDSHRPGFWVKYSQSTNCPDTG